MTRTFSHIERGSAKGPARGVAGRNNGVQRRIAVNNGLIRPPRASAGERGSAGNAVGPPRGSQLAHTARQGGRRGGSQRGVPRHRDLPRAGGPVARRPRLRSALARDTHQKTARSLSFHIIPFGKIYIERVGIIPFGNTLPPYSRCRRNRWTLYGYHFPPSLATRMGSSLELTIWER